MSAEVVYYDSIEGKDYLITRRIPGEDCTYEEYLDNPKKLCDIRGELLRTLHETKGQGCPIKDRMEKYEYQEKQIRRTL